jgi:hypothetical protein
VVGLTVAILVQHQVVIGTATAAAQDLTDYGAAAAQVTIVEHVFIHILPTAVDTA